uniref:Uncharacterized protein n=1 Tax=Cacopsylla melanoneura TaxID=428564 RepID=A0A8D8Z2D1_9HEMI
MAGRVGYPQWGRVVGSVVSGHRIEDSRSPAFLSPRYDPRFNPSSTDKAVFASFFLLIQLKNAVVTERFYHRHKTEKVITECRVRDIQETSTIIQIFKIMMI